MSFDSVEANRKFAEKYGFPFRLLSDPDRRVGLAYGAADDTQAPAARRISYLIDPAGKIHTVWPKVDTKVHHDEVIAQIP
jgi:peroxiredoxin Q/BCP